MRSGFAISVRSAALELEIPNCDLKFSIRNSDDKSQEAQVIRGELESQLTGLDDESKDVNELDQ